MNNKISSIIAGAMLAAGLMACSSSDGILGTGDAVTIVGRVTNIDTLAAAGDVKVYLYKHPEYTTTTDASGNFTLTLPKDTRFILVTDDKDGATTDDWFKTANYEIFQPIVNEALADSSGYQIHACPSKTSTKGWAPILQTDSVFPNGAITTSATYIDENTPSNPFGFSDFSGGASEDSPLGVGSVAVWDNFLASGSNAATLFPGVTSAAQSGGILSMVVFQSPFTLGMGDFPYASGIKVTSDKEAEFGPITYGAFAKYFQTYLPVNSPAPTDCAQFVQTPNPLGSGAGFSNVTDPANVFDATVTKTSDANPMITSFGKPSFPAGGELTLTITNEDGISVSNFPSSAKVFMEPGMISLVLWALHDENADGSFEAKSFSEFVPAYLAKAGEQLTLNGYCY